jgi:hypothetical protein
VATLALPKSERTAVFRAMVQVLRNDPIVGRVCRTILSWDGKPGNHNPLAVAMAPAIRITPVGGGDKWMSPASMVSPLYLNCEMVVAGYDADDLPNLWKAIMAAYYAPTGTTFAAIQAQLRAAGAYPPSPEFTDPAYDPGPGDNEQRCVARIMVMVQTQLGSRGT